MPRNILVKRRTVQDTVETAGTDNDRCADSETAGTEHFYLNRQDSEGFSECSSDSGRESALAGDKSSPSLSMERPQLLLYRSSTVSSSSSSENLQSGPDARIVQSPLSPYPLGHITLLPRILENLAVSGSHQAEIKVSPKNGTDHQPSETGTFTQQLPAPLPLNNALSIHSPCGHRRFNDTPATSTSAAQLPVLPFSWLSPASRKRSNSMGNSTDPAAPANANPQHSITSKPKLRKTKNGRRVGVDDVTTSPVSGTVITMPDNDITMPNDVIIVRRGDLDKTTNVVEVTEEAKLELAKIENKIGEYTCRLCRLQYPDAFQLAAHNCSRIVHIEYQCPECGKTFHCPANLASHRRWHKPKTQSAPSTPKVQKVLTIPKFRENSAPQKGTTVVSPLPLNDCKMPIENHAPPTPTIPSSQMPFKKRFFFGKGNPSKGTTASVQQKAEIVKFPPSFPRDTPICKPLDPQMENFRCQVCHGIVHGAEHFARHWHECLVAASKNWASFLFPSKHP